MGAQKLLSALAAPHRVAGGKLLVSGSIGISIYPVDGLDADILINCADSAMYRSKCTGRNKCSLFKDEKAVAALPGCSIPRLRADAEAPDYNA